MEAVTLLDLIDWTMDRHKEVIAIECGKIEEADKAYSIEGVNFIDNKVVLRIKEK